jgi:hypothetical protein
MLKNYRNSTNRIEISKIFDTSLNGENFIWQNLHGRRFIHHIRKIDFDRVLRLVRLELKENIKFIHPSSDLYVKLAEKETVSKLIYMNHENNNITCSLPEHVKSIELRSHQRYKIKKEQPIFAAVLLQSQLMKLTTRTMHLQVADISKNGISLIVLDRDYETLIDAHFCQISHINSVSLSKNIELSPIYNQTHKVLVGQKSKYGHKFGFKMTKTLEQYELDQVLLSIPG